jgi:hypothetical protein
MFKGGLRALVLGLSCLAWAGCEPADKKAPATPAKTDDATKTSSVAPDATATALVSTVYCGKCGELKGTDSCCAADAATCASCDLHKGSALCCKVDGELAGKDVCGKCGLEAGSADCCKTDAEQCPNCHLAASSPLCCKLHSLDGHDASEKTEDAAAAH